MPENWINKILDHQATPPEAAWEHIACELDKENQIIPGLKTKLFNYETAAPEIALKNIFDQLDKDETKIVPFKNNKKNQSAFFIKMAAAASVVVIIALFYFSNSKPGDAQTGSAVVTTVPKQPVNTPSVAKEEISLPAPATKEKNETAATIKNQKTTTEKPLAFPAYIQGNAIKELAQSPNTASTEKLQNEEGHIPMDISLMNTANTYINITGPDGQPVKVSSKLSSLVGYLNTNDINTQENLDVIIKESAKWRAIFAAWRNKMANNALAPSLTNFMDIIELSEVLENN